MTGRGHRSNPTIDRSTTESVRGHCLPAQYDSSHPEKTYPLAFSPAPRTRMLDEMDEDLETATANLSLVTLKTKELIQKSGGKRNFILIIMLTVIVIVLLFLVIYT